MNANATTGRRRVYTGKVINLDVDSIRFPDGSAGELEIIRHPGASAVVPVLGPLSHADPQLILIRQYRYAANGFLYEIPAGRLNPGERPEECARRELLEEVGCTASELTFLTTAFTTPGFTDERIHFFLAAGLTAGEPHREADEFIEVETMPLSRALNMVKLGEIQDAKTILGLLYMTSFRQSLGGTQPTADENP